MTTDALYNLATELAELREQIAALRVELADMARRVAAPEAAREASERP